MASEQPFLSVVIPAYNEAVRLPATLTSVFTYLQQQPYSTETIVVDDGSTDDTATLAEQQAATHHTESDRVIVLRCDHRGKGFAVRSGVLAAQGQYILICDADLAVAIEDWEKLQHELLDGHDVAIGSREGVGAKRLGEPWYRHVMGRIFNFIVRTVAVKGIQDTQCGFKALTYEASRDLFHRMRIYGEEAKPVEGAAVTAYDVELLFLAIRCGYRIAEVPVHWRYGTETKVDPLKDSLRNLRDVFAVRMNEWKGVYRATNAANTAPGDELH